MNAQDQQRQQQLQALAERAGHDRMPSGDPQVDVYRFVLHALHQPLPDALPGDFAQQVAQRLLERNASNRLERWLTNLLLLAMLVGVVWFALPPVVASMTQMLHAMNAEGLPMQSIGIAASGMIAAWMLDRYWTSHSHRIAGTGHR